jgi:hypothetical protein
MVLPSGSLKPALLKPVIALADIEHQILCFIVKLGDYCDDDAVPSTINAGAALVSSFRAAI